MNHINIGDILTGRLKESWPSQMNSFRQISPAIELVAKDVPSLIDSRNNAQQNTHVLELFGPGGRNGKKYMLRAASWTGVRIGRPHNTHARIINTNLYTRSGRDQVEEELHHVPGIILANPIGAFIFDNVTGLPLEMWWDYFQSFYNWGYKLLDGEGVFGSEIMHFIPGGYQKGNWWETKTSLIHRYAELLNNEGVDLQIGYVGDTPTSFLFQKHGGGIETLPYIRSEDCM